MNTHGHTLELTLKKREEIANMHFSSERISHLIQGEALKGLRHCRIVQDMELDLSATDAAKKIVLQLNEHGYRCHWLDTMSKGDLLRPKSGYTYQELEIHW